MIAGSSENFRCCGDFIASVETDFVCLFFCCCCCCCFIILCLFLKYFVKHRAMIARRPQLKQQKVYDVYMWLLVYF